MAIFITGTSSGIGNGLAKYYLSKGKTVVGLSRSVPADLDSIDRYSHITADLSELSSIATMVSDKLSDVEIDTVILNAGILPSLGDLSDISIDEIKKVMDINVWSNKMLIDSLMKTHSELKKLIAISSGAAVSGARGWNAYSISKASLNMMISLYAKEYPSVHFTAFAPGLVDTAMQDVICSQPDDDDYPVFGRLRSARGTEIMPDPEKAAEYLANAFDKLDKYESGSFVDIRKMD